MTEQGIDMDELKPEMNDIQKIYMGLASMNAALNDVQVTVNHDHKLLVEGNGEVPIVQKIRDLEKFMNGINFWAKTLAVAILLQTVAFGSAAIIYFIKLYPILQQIAARDILIK